MLSIGALGISLSTLIVRNALVAIYRRTGEQGTINETIINTLLTGEANTPDASAILADSDRLAARLAKQIEAIPEISNISVSERRSGTEAASKIFANNPIDKVLKTEKRYDPYVLSQLYISLGDSILRKESEASAAYASKLIHQLCQFSIELLVQLPSQQATIVDDLLSGNSAIISTGTRILNELQYVRHQLETPSRNDRHYSHVTEAYLHRILKTMGYLNIMGITTQVPPYKMSTAYIPLAFAGEHDDGSSAVDELYDSNYVFEHENTRLKVQTQDRDSGVFPIESAFQYSKRLLITGDPGSGKTTLVQWLASECLRRDPITGENRTSSVRLPLHVSLRGYANKEFPKFSELGRDLISHICSPDSFPKEWPLDFLKSNSALLLIDGFDELTPERRDAFAEWLGSFHELYPDCPTIITSRPAARPEEVLKRCDLYHICVLPLRDRQIRDLIIAWYKAVAEVGQSELTKDDALRESKLLWTELQNRPALKSLAATPLLAAAISALYLRNKHYLPQSRSQLYKECCDMLLGRRDAVQSISFIPPESLNDRRIKTITQGLALQMLKDGISEISLRSFQDYVRKSIDRFGIDTSSKERTKIYRWFCERGGVIRQPTSGRIDFVHKTFQEYLAAVELFESNDFALLQSKLNQESWREVILLATALLPIADAERLIDHGLQEVNLLGTTNPNCVLMLGELVQAAIGVSSKRRMQVAKLLDDLVPPNSRKDAQRLLSAGDIIIPYLKYERCRTDQQQVASVHALAGTRHDSAVKLLEDYALQGCDAALRELQEAWGLLSSNEYASVVLGEIVRRKGELYLTDVVSIEGLEVITRPYRLALEAPDRYVTEQNGPPIDGVVQLILSVTYFPEWYLSVSKFPKLRELVISQARTMPHVTSSGNMQKGWCKNMSIDTVVDLSTLWDVQRNYPYIQKISIADCPNLYGLHALEEMPHLKEVSLIGDMTGIGDIEPIINIMRNGIKVNIDSDNLQSLLDSEDGA